MFQKIPKLQSMIDVFPISKQGKNNKIQHDLQSIKTFNYIQLFLIYTSQETGRQYQPFLVPGALEIDLDCHHSHIFGCKWTQRQVCLFLQEPKWRGRKGNMKRVRMDIQTDQYVNHLQMTYIRNRKGTENGRPARELFSHYHSVQRLGQNCGN